MMTPIVLRVYQRQVTISWASPDVPNGIIIYYRIYENDSLVEQVIHFKNNTLVEQVLYYENNILVLIDFTDYMQ